MTRASICILLLVGCYGAHRDNPIGGDAAGPVCVESSCGGDGCCGDHCCTITPSNATDFGELATTGLVVAPPSGTFDTDAECVATSALGNCTSVARANLPQACVCRADKITITSLRVTGRRALVLLAKHEVAVQTLLDVSGAPGAGGPGVTHEYVDAGGVYGGAGGSFATLGAPSGADVAAAYGEPMLVPLLGGMSGRAAGGRSGGGGGALQITAGERIEVAGVINAGGGGGGGGLTTYATAGGGGGGSGGGVILEAPTVVVSGTVVASGGGGGGGGGNDGGGLTGNTGGKHTAGPVTAASGGIANDGYGCSLYGYAVGGDGGHGAIGAQASASGEPSGSVSGCTGGLAFVGGGGGGGGVGRIRVNTTSGCQCGGKLSPQPTFGMLVKQ